MAGVFEDFVNGMLNVSFGAAAIAAEKGKDFLDDLSAKGAEVRADPERSDFARSVSDAVSAAGSTVSGAAERMCAQGESMSDKVFDELVRMRVRPMNEEARAVFVEHVRDLVAHMDTPAVKVKVETVEVQDGAGASEASATEASTEATSEC